MSKGIYTPARKDLQKLLTAALRNPFDGQSMIDSSHRIVTRSIEDPGRSVSIVLTLDVGYHASGWWRNSDYDRCLHLSLTHPASKLIGVLETETPTDGEVDAWAKEVFGPHLSKVWTEPAASVFDIHGRQPHVPHVRLFLDKQNNPIKPEGEVYHLKPWADGTSPEKIFRRTTKH